ncbi:MAG TPA: hypothetical protein ENN55_00145 [Firmicutes bacterium]|mgnify:CR=1 FL=1|nr:hypothetical protein [Bacillota bacterium]
MAVSRAAICDWKKKAMEGALKELESGSRGRKPSGFVTPGGVYSELKSARKNIVKAAEREKEIKGKLDSIMSELHIARRAMAFYNNAGSKLKKNSSAEGILKRIFLLLPKKPAGRA